MAAAEGGRLVHVKPHGALNNQACEDAALADTVARAVRAFDRELILLAPALSELSAAGERAGLRVAAEIFADRAYTDAGTLAPRGQPGAVLHDADAVVAHVMRMLDAGGIVAASGKVLPTRCTASACTATTRARSPTRAACAPRSRRRAGGWWGCPRRWRAERALGAERLARLSRQALLLAFDVAVRAAAKQPPAFELTLRDAMPSLRRMRSASTIGSDRRHC